MNIKIENINTHVVKEVSKSIATEYLGTNEWKVFETKKVVKDAVKEIKEEKEVKTSKKNLKDNSANV